ncbi:16S rRNA (uracil(1498)-N(3))-methyltransferase [Aquirhabdus parva]|uniref:Ribosomal RNA small subunit methyltransferase E n=1 Tax=Aquirhabdus parva TaxID=2283318 RepID=A0A345P3I5_9GAMM|nr:16S rRNA (uracil(1498)-N(3))-methyltransferase [Aquirhabdus parva]AXI01844.1 16S rRNA (uracil(1498)-N(3))-methyltransferase [Aquirhabdus parva]
MNLLLLEPADICDQQATLTDLRRLKHIHETLKLKVGDSIKIGVRDGWKGSAQIAEITSERVVLSDMVLDTQPPAKIPLTLVLALPRPLVLRRLITDAVTMGVERLVLLNSRAVEKSYWQSQVFDELQQLVVLGLEQAGDTIAPIIELRPRFRPFVEDELPALVEGKTAIVAHPYATQVAPIGLTSSCVLVVGAEGGFIPFEIDLLEKSGCQSVSLGQRILRTETAVPLLIGRLMG